MAVKNAIQSVSELYLKQAIKDGRAVRQEMAIRALTVDQHFQSRVATDPAHSRHLASLLDLGIELREIVVFHNPETDVDLVADGFHRIDAYNSHKRPSIWAWVIEGDEAAAILYSAGANVTNSKPTTAEDRKKAVEMILDNEDLRSLPDDEIGKRCAVHKDTVRKYRAAWCERNGVEVPDSYVDKNGVRRKYPTIVTAKDLPKVVKRRTGTYAVTKKGEVKLSGDEKLHRSQLAGLWYTENVHKKRSLERVKLCEYFVRNGIGMSINDHYWGNKLGSLCGSGYLLVSPHNVLLDDLYSAFGRAVLLKTRREHSFKVAIICYQEDFADDVLRGMRGYGIEFYAPERFVAKIKAESGLPGDEPDDEERDDGESDGEGRAEGPEADDE